MLEQIYCMITQKMRNDVQIKNRLSRDVFNMPTVKLANSTISFKLPQVKFLQRNVLRRIKCVFHKQCQLHSVSL